MHVLIINPAGIYLVKVSNRKARTRCKICSKIIIKSFWCLCCYLWIYFTPCSSVSINFEHVIAGGERFHNSEMKSSLRSLHRHLLSNFSKSEKLIFTSAVFHFHDFLVHYIRAISSSTERFDMAVLITLDWNIFVCIC